MAPSTQLQERVSATENQRGQFPVEVKAETTLEGKVKDADDFFKKQAKNARRKFFEEVVRETCSLLDFSIAEHKPECTDYRTFLENFSETISQRIEPEIHAHNSKKICALIRGLTGIEKNPAYKTLEARASKIETQEAYEVFLKDAEKLADTELKNRYGELKKTIKAIKKGDKEAMSEKQISMGLVDYQTIRIVDKVRSAMGYREAKPPFNKKRMAKVKDVLSFLENASIEFLREELPGEIISRFFDENCISQEVYKKLRNKTFEYKINSEKINFKEVYSKALKLEQGKNPKTAVRNFINDIAQSVIIKNNEKQAGENRENRKDTGNKILDYSRRTEQLDAILNKLTRDYCAKNCPEGEAGCCGKHHYGDFMPEEALAMQEIESLKNKWHNRGEGECKYHSSDGCKLTLFKPPICIGHLCDSVVRYLGNELGYEKIKGFPGEMGKIKDSHLSLNCRNDEERRRFEALGEYDRRGLFSALDKAIATGNELVELKRQKQKAGEVK